MISQFLNTYWYPLFYTYKDKIISFSNRFIYPLYMVFSIVAGVLFAKGHWIIGLLSFIIGGTAISLHWYSVQEKIKNLRTSVENLKNT